MATKEKTRAQQWVDRLQRQRVSTILNRAKKLLDFAGMFYPVKIELRLQALELLPLKNMARTGQSLVFNISPRLNISISNVWQYQETGEYKIPTESFLRLTYLNHIKHTQTPGGRPIVRHFLFQPTYNNGRGDPAPTLTLRTHGALGASKDLSAFVRVGLRFPRPHLVGTFSDKLVENLYLYKKVAGAGDRCRWELPAGDSPPGPYINTYQHEVPFEYKRNYLSAPAIKTIVSNSGQSGDRLVRGSLSSSTAHIISTVSHTQVESFVNKKTTHPDRFLTQFYPLQRLDICHIPQAAKSLNLLNKKFYGDLGGGFSKEPPGGRRQQSNLSSTLELVTKKIKKIETRINVEKVEKTVVQNVSQQLDQTISQRINKRLAFDSRDTRQLTENIYSRLVNRIVLEKERLEY